MTFSACYKFVQVPNLILLAYRPTPWITPEKKEIVLVKSVSGTCVMKYEAKSKYLVDVISENSDNVLRLWNSINNIMHSITPPALLELSLRFNYM